MLPEIDDWFERLSKYTNEGGWRGPGLGFDWHGIPYSRTDKNNFDDYYRLVDNAIAISPTLMCLTSKHAYVRECKKWLVENGQDGVKMKDAYADET